MSTPSLTLDHVQLAAPADCEAAARAFFTGLLGLQELPKPETMAASGAWFQCADRELHVGVAPGFTPARKAHVALRTESGEGLDFLAARLEGAGHPVRWDARLPGHRRFFTEDPWGNRLELLAAAG